MKRTILFTLFVLCLVKQAEGQENLYTELTAEAWKLYDAREYAKSGQKYAEAFLVRGKDTKVSDRYNAACSWALANHLDAAFDQLFTIAKYGNYANYKHFTNDSDLKSLHDDPRWKDVKAIIWKNRELAFAKLDKNLVAILDTIYQEDQKIRLSLDTIKQQFGYQSKEVQAIEKLMAEKDSANLIKVKKILHENGWPGRDVIGYRGNLTLFLVIQHSDIKTQEKYLPMVRDAVGKGKADANWLALLEDRVAIRQGRKQIFGSQLKKYDAGSLYQIRPLEDPENVDKRRAVVGLEPLQEYVAQWDIIWNPKEYLEILPELIVKEKEAMEAESKNKYN